MVGYLPLVAERYYETDGLDLELGQLIFAQAAIPTPVCSHNKYII